MNEAFARTAMLLGEAGMARLERARVAVFGIGGVGGHAAEALARSGVGALELVDADVVSPSNLNRQIVALHSTVGMPKVEVAAARIHDINPDCEVTPHRVFFSPDTADRFDFARYDYVVDAIDTVTGKVQLIVRAKAAGVPIICAMGAGNKLDPTRFEVADIHKTEVCPLARVMRRECRRRGIRDVKVVYSREEPVQIAAPETGKPVPGSTAFVPAVAGLILAGEVVRDIALGRMGNGEWEMGN